jgi:hypothetical protein
MADSRSFFHQESGKSRRHRIIPSFLQDCTGQLSTWALSARRVETFQMKAVFPQKLPDYPRRSVSGILLQPECETLLVFVMLSGRSQHRLSVGTCRMYTFTSMILHTRKSINFNEVARSNPILQKWLLWIPHFSAAQSLHTLHIYREGGSIIGSLILLSHGVRILFCFPLHVRSPRASRETPTERENPLAFKKIRYTLEQKGLIHKENHYALIILRSRSRIAKNNCWLSVNFSLVDG